VTSSYSCSNNTLEVRWPTDIVYTEDVKEIPAKTRDMLTKITRHYLMDNFLKKYYNVKLHFYTFTLSKLLIIFSIFYKLILS